jgi:Fe-S-cluster-containing hydrogenase component 2
MVQKTLVVDPQKCIGCRQCELICSYAHEGVYSPALSRVRVVKFEERCLAVPTMCADCRTQVCREVCPTRALRPRADGAVVVDEARCIGCKECVLACPFGAASIHPAKGTAFRCDLCDGRALCVEGCPAGAIAFVELARVPQEKRRSRAAAIAL